MSLKKILATAFATLVIAGCGTPPKFQERRQSVADNKVTLGSSQLVQQTNHMTQHLNSEKTILYTQPYGGGGVGLGLLLGPIGVAANVAMIESATKADAQRLFGKILIDPIQSFTKSAKSAGIDLTGSSSISVTPYLYVAKVSESSINIGVALISEQGSQPPAKYMYQLPRTYTIEDLSSLDQTRQEELKFNVDSAFTRLAAFYLKDSGPSNAPESKIQFKSSFLAPRFEFVLQGTVAQKEDDVTWIRTFGGVYGLQSSTFSLSAAN
ncbi:MAG: hypothetical protein K2Q07_10015 [Burkholderiaceae bacterium]|nr:hypothetical protein [Burkholderiaceae bacterium]